MTQQSQVPPSAPDADGASGATSTSHETAINATRGNETDPLAGEGLPDLSRLSLANEPGTELATQAGISHGDALAPASVPGSGLNLAVYSHGAPVTINVYHGATQAAEQTIEVPRTSRIIRSQVHEAPTLPPARISAPAHPGAVSIEAAPPAYAPASLQPAQPAELAAAAGGVATAPVVNPGPAGAEAPSAPVVQGADTPPPPPPHLHGVPESPVASTSALLPFEAYEDIAPRDPTHNRWYVVTAGRRVGIWREWLDMADYVTRVPGNQHKSFATRAEAEQHYYANKAAGNVQVILP